MQTTQKNNNPSVNGVNNQNAETKDKTNDALKLLSKMRDVNKKCKLVLHFDGKRVKEIEINYFI